ncbi:MAG: HNH endonuclease [Bacteroidetes bacterium]|nr:HNH endonuclease [Bacteroidota bacterium]
MASHNTVFDAANTAVRAFLTKLGEYYLGRNYNTGSGRAKVEWEKIREIIFEGRCAYCGKRDSKLQVDHLIMFNRTQFGLHHPGNIVPSCSKCNNRSKHSSGSYNNWEDHLSFICERNEEPHKFHERWKKIKLHITEGEFAYPKLTEEEIKAIRIIANDLYESIKTEFYHSIELYKELDSAFSKRIK